MKNMTNTVWLKTVLLVLFMVSILGVLVMAGHGRVVTAQEEDITNIAPNCRYGVTAAGENAGDRLGELGVGWTITFSVTNNSFPNNIRLGQVVRFKPDFNNATGYRIVSPSNGFAGLDNIIAQNPGALWLIGNEVDRKDVQDDLHPHVYARAYRDVYYHIKQRDHTARIAISGLVRISPGRLQYLDMVWDSYQQQFGQKMPVDVWNFHAYNLPELDGNGNDGPAAVANGTDPALALRYLRPGESPTACDQADVVCFKEEDDINAFIDQVVTMRQWMKDKGEQNKPLILSEYSILAPYNPLDGFLQDENGESFTPPRVSAFMQATYDYLESAADPNLGYPADNYRLVQQWMWYPLAEANPDAAGSSSALVDRDTGLYNQIGQTHFNWVSTRPRSSNVIMAGVNGGSGVVIPPATTGSANVYVQVRNNGNLNTSTGTSIQIRDQNGGFLATTSVPSGLGGCAMETATAVATINNLPPGFHPITAHINGSNAPEKVGSGIIFIGTQQLFLPISTR